MRLIDASKFDLKGAEITWIEQSDYSITVHREKVYEIPTVDAAPVKHGKWNHIGTLKRYVGMSVETCSEFRCSVCDSPKTFFVPIAHYHYCPNCGSLMDLEG